jgi:hypothetical protein
MAFAHKMLSKGVFIQNEPPQFFGLWWSKLKVFNFENTALFFKL